jgi:hypothetical protein
LSSDISSLKNFTTLAEEAMTNKSSLESVPLDLERT